MMRIERKVIRLGDNGANITMASKWEHGDGIYCAVNGNLIRRIYWGWLRWQLVLRVFPISF